MLHSFFLLNELKKQRKIFIKKTNSFKNCGKQIKNELELSFHEEKHPWKLKNFHDYLFVKDQVIKKTKKYDLKKTLSGTTVCGLYKRL